MDPRVGRLVDMRPVVDVGAPGPNAGRPPEIVDGARMDSCLREPNGEVAVEEMEPVDVWQDDDARPTLVVADASRAPRRLPSTAVRTSSRSRFTSLPPVIGGSGGLASLPLHMRAFSSSTGLLSPSCTGSPRGGLGWPLTALSSMKTRGEPLRPVDVVRGVERVCSSRRHQGDQALKQILSARQDRSTCRPSEVAPAAESSSGPAREAATWGR